ncbi:MAG: hypothetical protein DCC71_09125 [Proteobacteria bacterium]|nr:MAG: hypothetical protein DCC71_09125 [Pseudomonadota bacterium]
MRRSILASGLAFGLALGLLALVAAGAQAQEARKADAADTATVSRVDAAAGRFSVRDDATTRETEYRVDETTRILSGAKQMRLEDLKAGDRVTVTATHEGATPTETPVANLVSVVVDRPEDATGTTGTDLAPSEPTATDPKETEPRPIDVP